MQGSRMGCGGGFLYQLLNLAIKLQPAKSREPRANSQELHLQMLHKNWRGKYEMIMLDFLPPGEEGAAFMMEVGQWCIE